MGCFDIFLLQGSAFTPHFKEKKLNWQISATGSGYWLGTPGYLIAVLGSIFIVWTILYAPWEISRRRNFSG
ncbi:hypothetical protein [Trichococcus shcherbakoviae]